MSEKWKRTREGCIVCRRRRKRCDLRKPTCGGCERNALLCRWTSIGNADDQLPVGTDTLAPMSGSASLQPTHMGLGVASHMLKAPISFVLFTHYLHETGNAISAHRGPLNSFTRILPCLAMTYPNTVLQSLLALSGVHYGSRGSNIDVDIMTFTHLGVALRSLKHGITASVSSQSNADSLHLLVTTLILCILETIRTDQDGGITHHLEAANVLFNRLQDKAPLDEEIWEFLKEFYAYVRTISVLTGYSISPNLPSTSTEPKIPLVINGRIPGNLLGCSHDLFNLVPHIEVLISQMQIYQDATSFHQMDAAWYHEYNSLHSNLSSWQPPESCSTDFASSGYMYQQALLYLVEKASPLACAQNMETITAFRVTQFLNILNSFPIDAPISTTIIWPLVFFGVLSANQASRALIYKRLSHMQSMFGFGNIKSSMDFLQAHWDRQDEDSAASKSRSNGGTSDLITLMKNMNLDISFV